MPLSRERGHLNQCPPRSCSGRSSGVLSAGSFALGIASKASVSQVESRGGIRCSAAARAFETPRREGHLLREQQRSHEPGDPRGSPTRRACGCAREARGCPTVGHRHPAPGAPEPTLGRARCGEATRTPTCSAIVVGRCRYITVSPISAIQITCFLAVKSEYASPSEVTI